MQRNLLYRSSRADVADRSRLKKIRRTDLLPLNRETLDRLKPTAGLQCDKEKSYAELDTAFKIMCGKESNRKRVTRAEPCLALATLDLGTSLTDFVTWIALANHVNSTATTYDLAIGVSVLEGTDG